VNSEKIEPANRSRGRGISRENETGGKNMRGKIPSLLCQGKTDGYL